MSSIYTPIWKKYFPENKIDELLNDLRVDNRPNEFDVTDIKEVGERSSWNSTIVINESGILRGNAAHLNALAKIVSRYLQSGEVLRLRTKIDGDRIIFSIYFETSPAESGREFARKTTRPMMELDQSSYLLDYLNEDKIASYLRDYFERNGYSVFEQANITKDGRIKVRGKGGADIIATKGISDIWVIEVKGVRSRDNSAQYSEAITTVFGQMIQRMKPREDNIKYAIALPVYNKFYGSLRRYAGSFPIMLLKIHLILVDKGGKITIKNPQEFYEFLKELKG